MSIEEGKYRVHTTVNGKKKHLGYFSTLAEAAAVAQQARVAAFGEFAA